MTADAGDVAYPDLEHQLRVFDQINHRLTGDWIEINGTVIKSGPWIPISHEMLRDQGWYPWESPHRNPMPHLVLFPRLAHLTARARFARDRIRDTVEVLCHGLPEPEEHDAW